MIPITERMPNNRAMKRNGERQREIKTRVASPGIIESFDPESQTASVQLAIREKREKPDGVEEWVQIPLLVDVPVLFPRAGGYVITMPVERGDECLVVFGDSCMDAWWQSGGIQNQIDLRRHDLSDGFAIMGLWSQPRRIEGYTNTCRLRTVAGDTYVELSGGNINIVASGTVNIQGAKVTINE